MTLTVTTSAAVYLCDTGITSNTAHVSHPVSFSAPLPHTGSCGANRDHLVGKSDVAESLRTD